MISWISFAIAALKLVNSIILWANKRELIDEGRRQIILEQSLAIARRIADDKRIKDYVDKLTDTEVDRELERLERD